MTANAGARSAPFWFEPLRLWAGRHAASQPLATSVAPRTRRLKADAASGTALEGRDDPAANQDGLPKRLPLYHRQGSVVLLDDAPDFLEALVPTLPRHWNIEVFLSAQTCLNYLQQEPPKREADLWAQQRIVDAWRSGEPLVPNILRYWQENPIRFALTKVCVIDHLMPGMTGLEMLEELVDWPGQRILVTGEFDAAMANAAFNRGVIDYFLPKQSDRISARLIDAVRALMNRGDPRQHQIWAATLTPEQAALLRTPSVAHDLADFVSATFIEWVVIGQPFGILGLSAAGVVSWLQLQPTSGLEQLADLAGRHGASAEDVAHIRAGRCVHDIELRSELRSAATAQTTPAFYVGDEGTLLAGIHRVVEAPSPTALSYHGWLRTQARRRAENQSRF